MGVKVSRSRQRPQRATDRRVPARERTPPRHLAVCRWLGPASTGQLGRTVGLACGWQVAYRLERVVEAGRFSKPSCEGTRSWEEKPVCIWKRAACSEQGEEEHGDVHQTPQRPELPRHGSARCSGPKKPHTKKQEVHSFVAFVMGQAQFTRPDFGAEDSSAGGQQGYRSRLLERPTPDFCLRPRCGGSTVGKLNLLRGGDLAEPV